MNTQLILNNLNELLIARNWKLEERKTKYNIFVPPVDLNFEKSYKLFVYNQITYADFEKEIIKDLDIISQIYNEDIEELNSIVIEDKQILTLHIEKDDIVNGRPSIPFFNKLMNNSKDLLQVAANFTVKQTPHYFDDKTEEAERYLNYCNFFKNDVGSLITKIQLPNKEEIKETNLFSKPIEGSQINKKLLDVTDFINRDIIALNNFEPSDDFLLTNQDFVSVNVAEKLKKLYTDAEYSNIDISLKGITINEVSKAEGLNKEKVGNLTKFSRIVKEKMKDISTNIVYGKIVELKSKDVDSDKNTIIVVGKIKNVQSTITVELSSEQIKQASETFKNNKPVEINAILEKEKTQYKVKDLIDLKLY
ncbi:MAG: hypothetical protein LBR81_01810 [Prevotellaceae bacterium]|jgi:hypothetical protein|nr:hypothetical protein [Prevotellaceae bacterium]